MKNDLVWTDVECYKRDASESAMIKSSGKLWSGAFYLMATLALTTLLGKHRSLPEEVFF